MSAEEAAGWVEIIKAVAAALSVLIGAIGLAYGRIAAKQAKKAVAQTATKHFVDGEVRTKSTATTAEQALEVAQRAQTSIDGLLERERQRGAGIRRADTQPQPDLRTIDATLGPPATSSGPLPADTAMFARLHYSAPAGDSGLRARRDSNPQPSDP